MKVMTLIVDFLASNHKQPSSAQGTQSLKIDKMARDQLIYNTFYACLYHWLLFVRNFVNFESDPPPLATEEREQQTKMKFLPRLSTIDVGKTNNYGLLFLHRRW